VVPNKENPQSSPITGIISDLYNVLQTNDLKLVWNHCPRRYLCRRKPQSQSEGSIWHCPWSQLLRLCGMRAPTSHGCVKWGYALGRYPGLGQYAAVAVHNTLGELLWTSVLERPWCLSTWFCSRSVLENFLAFSNLSCRFFCASLDINIEYFN